MTTIYDSINAANSASSSSSTSTSAAAEMGDRFMTLFLAQLQNQDPLNPMDNSEMTSQLAQMNMVSGLESLNASMQTLMSSYNEALSLQAANLIGKNVLVDGSNLTLTEEGSLFGIDLSGPADAVTVTITDSNGNVVATQSLGQQDAGSMAFYWDGTDLNGDTAEAGNYKFSVTATLDGESVSVSPLQAGTVSALIKGNSGFELEVAGVGNFTLDDVRQVF